MDLNNAKTLLIIRFSSLGDILLTTPLVRAIKKKYPQAKISFFVKEQYKDLLSLNSYLSSIYIYKKEISIKNNLELNGIKSQKFDLIIDLQNNFRSRILSAIIGGSVKRFHKKTFLKFILVNFKINKLKLEPEIPIRYAKAAGNITLDDNGLDLFVPATTEKQLPAERKYIGFAPGSRHFTKMWPQKYYADLGNYLLKSGYTIVLFGGQDDKEICARLASEIPGSFNLCNDDKIAETASNMKECSAVICNDSGLMHVACALRIPVLAVFGSTVREFGFIPYKNKSIILENENLTCRPCTHIGRESCPKKHFKCMMELTPLLAFNKLKLLLESQ